MLYYKINEQDKLITKDKKWSSVNIVKGTEINQIIIGLVAVSSIIGNYTIVYSEKQFAITKLF